MSFRAHSEYLAVRREDPIEVSEGGIVIPSSSVEKMNIGEVISVGGWVSEEINPGMTVVFQPFSGFDIEVDGQKLTIVKDENILGVIE